MNALWRSAATLAILAAVTPTAAMAQGPRPSGSGAAGFVNVPVDPAAAKTVPHYEWQYHYAGRHAHWEGHWVLVKPPIAAPGTPGAGGKLKLLSINEHSILPNNLPGGLASPGSPGGD
jgi:hypothetical protein